MKKTLTSLLTLAGFATFAGAQTYYSVDVTNDVLYKINSTTGVATAVGPIMADLDTVDMTWQQGALYAKSNSTTTGTRIYQLVTVGMYAGLALPGAAINGGGYQGAEVAGLASNGSSLFMTYCNQPPVNFYSTVFGSINPLTGTLSSPQAITTDADAMCYTGGKFWTVDVIAPGSGYQIYNGAATPNTYVGGDVYDTSLQLNPTDLEYLSSTQLIAIGQTGRFLVRLNRSNGTRLSWTPITGIPNNAKMQGIAYQPPCLGLLGDRNPL